MKRPIPFSQQTTFEKDLEESKKRSPYYEESLRLRCIDEIIKVLDSQGISNSELAKRLGTSRSYITKLLRGCQNLTLDSLARIAFSLGHEWKTEMIPLGNEVVTINYGLTGLHYTDYISDEKLFVETKIRYPEESENQPFAKVNANEENEPNVIPTAA